MAIRNIRNLVLSLVFLPLSVWFFADKASAQMIKTSLSLSSSEVINDTISIPVFFAVESDDYTGFLAYGSPDKVIDEIDSPGVPIVSALTGDSAHRVWFVDGESIMELTVRILDTDGREAYNNCRYNRAYDEGTFNEKTETNPNGYYAAEFHNTVIELHPEQKIVVCAYVDNVFVKIMSVSSDHDSTEAMLQSVDYALEELFY